LGADSNAKLASNSLWVFLGIDRNPFLNLICELFLEILKSRLDDLTRTAGRRPEVKNNNTTHSIFSTVT
jgi:hypothetical protein